ncbi:DUF2281 domain-containing protein [Chlorobium sp. KB01]|uniref:DUF2281 domain-containing protein n=1 Tax=Chlorobium sp. KB01 TaxID=1917528 RepID=UPI0009755614|nr:DUF2281 domain-containing protein [Chlorobium sp. KB01]
MTTAEKIYRAVKDLPEPMLHEVLDFAEFLKRKNSPNPSLAKKTADTDNYFANPKVIEAIERGKKDIKEGRVTKITDPNNIWDSILS